MPNPTEISWTDLSSNMIRARRLDTGKTGHFCTMKNEKCTNCYARAINTRFGTGLDFNKKHRENIEFFFHEPEADALKRLNARLAGKGETRRVFVSSMTDLFQETMSFHLIDRVFETIRACQNLTFQILTKRALIARDYVAARQTDFPANVRFGLTPDCGGYDIPLLLDIPARVLWLSLEPLLQPIRLDNIRSGGFALNCFTGAETNLASFEPSAKRPIDWIVIGGESGTGVRQTDLDNFRDIIKQRDAFAHVHKTFIWVKQTGSRAYQTSGGERVRLRVKGKGESLSDLPPDLRIRELPLEVA